MNNQDKELLLGKQTDYPKRYTPKVLQPISRALGRENLAFGLNVGKGFDCWHLYELSWLDELGKPQVGIGRLLVPADSPNIVESKSLKLYCNSLNFHYFTGKGTQSNQAVIATIKKDIAQVVKATVKFELLSVDDLLPSLLSGDLIDNAVIDEFSIQDAVYKNNRGSLLALSQPPSQKNKHALGRKKVSQILYSHLLRSNCPVTNQPDWASLAIRYEGDEIDQAALLNYVLSFREHNGFHEQCIEEIYADILTLMKPEKLLVQAWYTRRGGIDINPCRVSDTSWLPKPSRLVRQ